MFKKGDPKPAGSGRKIGRPAGALGVRGRLAHQVMEEEGVDPLRSLLRLARNKRLALEFRADCMKACLPHLYPRLQAQSIDMRSLQVQVTERIDQVLHSLPADEVRALEAVAIKFALLSPADDAATVPVTPRELPAGAVIDTEPEQD